MNSIVITKTPSRASDGSRPLSRSSSENSGGVGTSLSNSFQPDADYYNQRRCQRSESDSDTSSQSAGDAKRLAKVITADDYEFLGFGINLILDEANSKRVDVSQYTELRGLLQRIKNEHQYQPTDDKIECSVESLKDLEKKLHDSNLGELAKTTGMMYRRLQLVLLSNGFNELKSEKEEHLHNYFPHPGAYHATRGSVGQGIPAGPGLMAHWRLEGQKEKRISDTRAFMNVEDLGARVGVASGIPGFGHIGGEVSIKKLDMTGYGGYYKPAKVFAEAQIDSYLATKYPKAFSLGDGKSLHQRTMNEAGPLMEDLKNLLKTNSTNIEHEYEMPETIRFHTPDAKWNYPWYLKRWIYGGGLVARALNDSATLRVTAGGSRGLKVLYEPRLATLRTRPELLAMEPLKRITRNAHSYSLTEDAVKELTKKVDTLESSELITPHLQITPILGELRQPISAILSHINEYSRIVNQYELAKRERAPRKTIADLRQQKRTMEDESLGISSSNLVRRTRERVGGESVGRAGFYSRMTSIYAQLLLDVTPLAERLQGISTDENEAEFRAFNKLVGKVKYALTAPSINMTSRQVQKGLKMEEWKRIGSHEVSASAKFNLAALVGIPYIGGLPLSASIELKTANRYKDDIPDYEGIFHTLDIKFNGYVPPTEFAAVAALSAGQLYNSIAGKWGKSHGFPDRAKIQSVLNDALCQINEAFPNGGGFHIKTEMRQGPSGKPEVLAHTLMGVTGQGVVSNVISLENVHGRGCNVLGQNSIFYLLRMVNGDYFAGKEGRVWDSFVHRPHQRENIQKMLKNMLHEGNSAHAEYLQRQDDLNNYIAQNYFLYISEDQNQKRFVSPVQLKAIKDGGFKDIISILKRDETDEQRQKLIEDVDLTEKQIDSILTFGKSFEEKYHSTIENLESAIKALPSRNGRDSDQYGEALKAFRDFGRFINQHSYNWDRKKDFFFPGLTSPLVKV